MKYKKIEPFKDIDDFFEWRVNGKYTVEEQTFNDKIYEIMNKWEYKDVLYSFVGIYTIGLWVYYPKDFEATNYTIRNKDTKKYVTVDFLKDNYKEYGELNSLEELQNFIKLYTSVGNIIPVWPGANVHKGRSFCFDIPDIYFKKHSKWTNALIKMTDFSFLDGVLNSIYSADTKEFLNIFRNDDGKNKYVFFLKHCTSVIKEREINIGEGRG